MNIIPAILPKNRDELIEKLQLLSAANYSGRIQIDLCDGNYVPSKTWPFTDDINNTQTSFELMNMIRTDTELQQLLSVFTLDLDIMVKEPETKMMIWNMFHPDRIIIHLNSILDSNALKELFNSSESIDVIKKKSIVFAFSLDTDITLFDDWYHEFGFRSIQVMGIEQIGKQGEEFSEHTFDTIRALQDRFSDLEIMVDGGINITTARWMNGYGVSSVVSGSAVFKNNDILENLASMESMV